MPGYYYINVAGQLVKVKVLLYVAGKLARVIIEYLDGRVSNVAAAEWDWLDLACYNEWLTERAERNGIEREL